MCQVCAIKQLAAKERWPKSVEAHKRDLNFLVDAIHDEYLKYQAKKLNTPSTTLPSSLLELLRTLSHQLDVLESDREIWWTSPEKRALRQHPETESDQKRLSELHKINNTTVSSIETLEAKLGQFVRWGLGLNGGIEYVVSILSAIWHLT